MNKRKKKEKIVELVELVEIEKILKRKIKLKIEKRKITTYTFLLCAAILCSSCSKAHGAKMYLEAKTQQTQKIPEAEEAGTEKDSKANNSKTSADDAAMNTQDTAIDEQVCYIYVCGAVKHPGVFELPQGSRVYEAIALAGGFCDNAYQKGINQAAKVTDGEMIEVLTVQEQKKQKESEVRTKGQDTENTGSQDQDDRVDLNTASAEQFMALNGIGQAKAENIIAYRESSGGFSSVEELLHVNGIGESVYERIKDKVKVTQ